MQFLQVAPVFFISIYSGNGYRKNAYVELELLFYLVFFWVVVVCCVRCVLCDVGWFVLVVCSVSFSIR